MAGMLASSNTSWEGWSEGPDTTIITVYEYIPFVMILLSDGPATAVDVSVSLTHT